MSELTALEILVIIMLLGNIIAFGLLFGIVHFLMDVYNEWMRRRFDDGQQKWLKTDELMEMLNEGEEEDDG